MMMSSQRYGLQSAKEVQSFRSDDEEKQAPMMPSQNHWSNRGKTIKYFAKNDPQSSRRSALKSGRKS